jgi:phytoene synthase
MVEGWEALLEPELDRAALLLHAERRGGELFAALGTATGAGEAFLRQAGSGWALADLAAHLRDGRWADEARDMARAALDHSATWRWPPAARAIGALACSARLDLATPPRPRGHPARAARLLWLRLTGR